MRGQPVLFSDLHGGLNSKDAPYAVPDGAARDLLNVVSTAKGAIRKRDGSVQFAAVDATSLFATFQPKNLIAATGTKLQKITTLGAVSDIKTGLTDGLSWEWVEAPVSGGLGPAWGMNGTDVPQAFDGGAATVNWTATVGAVPNGKYMLLHGNRVWVAVGSRVYWSEIGDPRNWPVANVTAFDENDGGDITGIGKVGPYILVFKEKKTWVITDLDTSANRKLSDGVGCVAHRSIVETPRGTLFLAQPGVYRTDGNTLEKVSIPVDPTLTSVSPAYRRNVAGGYFNDHYYLSFARGAATPDRTLDFDFTIGSWWLHSLAARQWTVWEPSSGLELLGAVQGRVSRCFVPGGAGWTDAGAVYPGGSFWSSAFHAFGAPSLRKRAKRISFDGSGKIQFEVARNFAVGTDVELNADLSGAADGLWGVDDGSRWGVDDGSVWGGFSTVAEARAASLGVARSFSVKFGNLTADPFEVDSYTLFISPRKD